MKTDLELLEEKLKAHDWSYEMSDDFSKWERGLNQKNEIIHLIKKVGKIETLKLFRQLNRQGLIPLNMTGFGNTWKDYLGD